jgi:hypothetical protein
MPANIEVEIEVPEESDVAKIVSTFAYLHGDKYLLFT